METRGAEVLCWKHYLEWIKNIGLFLDGTGREMEKCITDTRFLFKIQDTIFMTHDHHKTESIFSIVCGVKTSMLGSVETSYVNMIIRKLSRVAS